MIDVWRAWVRRLRRCRAVLLPVLVVLIAAHITGASHGAAFTGPHVFVGSACPHVVAAEDASRHAVEAPPAHGHGAGDHVDHAVDRPRTAGAATEALPVALDTETAGLTDGAVRPLVLSAQRPFVPEGSTPRRHRPQLSTRCVWRQ
ncbi:hypothetical protein ACGFZU_38355 [Streptomyces tendae]|uniref:hypothetical protein n=1 Tax=Streptomyces tendae TaxID=1932 RepID=UPI00371847DA